MQGNGLTIGIPAYNEEASIERAIRSAAPQCERLIVSDNASNDGTEAVCRRLASEFPNLDYVRQPENIGATRNIISIAAAIGTPFLMVLGAHDHLAADYVDSVLPLVATNDDTQCAMGQVAFFDEHAGGAIPVGRAAVWHGGETDDPVERVWRFFTEGGALVWATYGIFRTATFRKVFVPDLPVFGPDAILIANTLRIGKIRTTERTTYHARNRPKEKPGRHRKRAYLAYFERVTGTADDSRDIKGLVNDYRLRQYAIIRALYPDDPPLRAAYRRFLCMARFKPFTTGARDWLYPLFYLPALVTNQLARPLRKLRRRLP